MRKGTAWEGRRKLCYGIGAGIFAAVWMVCSACGSGQDIRDEMPGIAGGVSAGKEEAGGGTGKTEGLPAAEGDGEPLAAGKEEAGDSVLESGEEENFREEGRGDGDPRATNSGEGERKEAYFREKFGESCIAGQTFEVELSEYDGKVYFVPYAPDEGNSDFHMEIVRDDKVLADIAAYVPERLAGEPFRSLDAVSFYDINYDGNTDIVLLATYGDTGFAAVYYGFDAASEDYRKYFMPQETLSDNLSCRLETFSISEIRKVLSGGKKNGMFSCYQEAYLAVGQLCRLENPEMEYDLIYFDNDDIPELVAGQNGYFLSLYTYSGGSVYVLMDHWGYGAMGNAGYEYSPRKNSLRNYNSDYAGAIMYTTYMTVRDGRSLETEVQIKTYNFDDSNGNGVPDEEESGSIGYYSVSYIDGAEVSREECDSYDAGEYRFISGSMGFEELEARLKEG